MKCFFKNKRALSRGKHVQVTLITLEILIAFALSLASVLDCDFIKVNIGFLPINFNDNFLQDTSALPLGLWAAPNPNPSESQCLPLLSSKNTIGMTENDSFYEEVFYNGDIFWSLSRVFALFTLAAGFIDLVMWILICSGLKWSNGKYFVLCCTTFAFMCESVKYGTFLYITPCSSNQYWERYEGDTLEVINDIASDCIISRGAYLSMTSILIYVVATISLAIYSSDDSTEYAIGHEMDYDDISMPSFLQSIGESLTSKFSKTSSMLSSRDGAQKRLSASEPAMAPIKEYDDDDC